MTLLKVGVENIVDELGADLELGVEVRVTIVALGLDIILHTGNDLGIIDIAEVVSLQEASEIHTEQIAHGVNLSSAGGIIFKGLDCLHRLRGTVFASYRSDRLGSAGYDCGTHCECKENFGCFHCKYLLINKL